MRVEPEDQSAVKRLARYVMRPPISLDRMSWDGEGEVRYRRKQGHERPGLKGFPGTGSRAEAGCGPIFSLAFRDGFRQSNQIASV